jgi:uncharacterized membrane protein
MRKLSMIDSFGSIPSHPLLVHIPVVLIPLSLISTVSMLILPSARRRYGTLTIALVVLATAGTVLAARSGRTLAREYTDAGRTIPDLLQQHIDDGNRLQYLIAAYLIAMIIWFVRTQRGPVLDHDGMPSSRARLISAFLVAFVLVAGTSSAVSTLRTSHSGTRSVWEQPSGE